MTLERAFALSVTLVALLGFLMLYLTGEFPPYLILPAFPLLGAAFFIRKWLARVPTFLWDLVTLIGFVAILPIARSSLLNATVYFFLFLQLVKVLSMRRPRDAFSVYVISFFQVLAAAVLTTSPVFGFAFLAYAGLLSWSLMLTIMLMGALSVQQFAPAAAPAPKKFRIFSSSPYLPESIRKLRVPSLRLVVLFLTLLILCISIAVFVITPRFSTRRLLATLGARGEPPAVSAFEESVEFGSYRKIQLDNSVALYVRPDQPELRPNAIRLRGVALDYFDGRRWRRSTWTTDQAPFPQLTIRPLPARWNTIVQPPNVTRFIFGETFPQRLVLELDQVVLSDPYSASAWLPYVPAKEIHYRVFSRVETLEQREPPERYQRPIPGVQTSTSGSESPTTHPLEIARRFAEHLARAADETLRASGERTDSRPLSPDDIFTGRGPRAGRNPGMRGAFGGQLGMASPRYVEACLQIPNSLDTQKLRAFAMQIVGNRQTAYEKALAIESYLRSRYQYTLEQIPDNPKNPVEDFLFESRRGHCEYFATAMVMLLRSLDIPARIVNGYYSAEWNNFAKSFTVRQRDAHSWVEVFFPGYGWMTFDPTPPDAIGRAIEFNPYLLTAMRLWDSVKLRWYRVMIDFSIEDQRFVAGTFLRMFASHHEEVAEWGGGNYAADDSMRELAPSIAGVVLVGGALVLVLLSFRGRWAKAKGRKTKRSARGWSPPPEFYGQLLKEFERLGYHRAVHETPREFAERIAKSIPEFASFAQVTQWYYGYRYGEHELMAEQLHAIQELRNSVRRYAQRHRHTAPA
ncbi:MAG: DUF3488 domain-containing protein [Candidatus Hydrogenedentota bacterium]|nr:MAG: DUF3488 domain-containing protein [Candidatus Hydrogenedentota bacterium]